MVTTKKSLAVKNDKLDFTPEQVELIKQQIAVGATDNELKLFLYQAARTGLDPLSRQIYFIKRQGKGTIQTSIDGFRAIAERSRDYAGQDEPKFEETPNGKFPKKCTVTVFRFHGDTRYPAGVGVAYWDEYKPASGQDFMWFKMPHTMLSKVAEALALRKAFPQDLSGLYVDEEIEQPKSTKPESEKNGEVKPEPVQDGEIVEGTPSNLTTPEQIKKYFAVAKSAGFKSEEAKEYVKKLNKVEHLHDLTTRQMSETIDMLSKRITESRKPIRADQETKLNELLNKKGKTYLDLKNAIISAYKKNDYKELTAGQADTVITKLEQLPDVQKIELPAEDVVDVDEVDKAIEEQKKNES